MAPRESPSVTPAELAVLERLWQTAPATIAELRDALYPEGGSSKFATVQKLLERLEEKRLVGRKKTHGHWLFCPRVSRDALIGDELRRVAQRLGEASLAPLLTCLVEAGELSAAERRHLRRLLDEPNATNRTASNRDEHRGDAS